MTHNFFSAIKRGFLELRVPLLVHVRSFAFGVKHWKRRRCQRRCQQI